MDAARQEGRLGKAYTAPSITVFYDRARCRHDAEYVRGLPQVFDVTWRLWVRADLADAEAVAEVEGLFLTAPPAVPDGATPASGGR